MDFYSLSQHRSVFIKSNKAIPHRIHCQDTSSRPSFPPFPVKMNRLLASLVVVVALTIAPSSSSALLFSPLLLTSPWGVHEQRRRATSTKVPTPQMPRVDSSSTMRSFDHDDDLMRYKHEVLSDVYEKSLNRGFVGGRSEQLRMQ